jgi:acyl carrier protein
MGLDLVELQLDIEDTFGIRFGNQEAGQICTVGALAQAVYLKLQTAEKSWFC